MSKKLTIALVLIVLSMTSIIGCKSVNLYLIDKQDIVKMDTGTTYTSDRPGYFLSKEYIDKVLAARVQK